MDRPGQGAALYGAMRDVWLAALCAVAAPLLLWQEGLDNRQALGLALNWLALAIVTGWPGQRATAAS